MELDTSSWKMFRISEIFDVSAGQYYYPDDYSEGKTPYCSASAENNGIAKKIDLPPDFSGNNIITGKVGCPTFYQNKAFCATSDVNVLTPKFKMTVEIGLFITTVINKNENYRWNYGRQCRVRNTKAITIKLPVCKNADGSIKIDNSHQFSSDGFVPDFEFMEKYMKSIKYPKISTKNSQCEIELNVNMWKEFMLHKIFCAEMGNGIDAINTSSDAPLFHYISRGCNDNGVVGEIDAVDGEKPFSAGTITLALGGSLGSCFVQTKPFYTAQNVAILHEKCQLSYYAKLFICTLIQHECKIKYQAFGRELNAHFRKDFILKLPIQINKSGEPVIDPNKIFSEEGYIPDWQYMEKFMKLLPYGDCITG